MDPGLGETREVRKVVTGHAWAGTLAVPVPRVGTALILRLVRKSVGPGLCKA